MKNRFSGKNPFTGAPLFWNAALVHELTPFGFAIDCDVMARTEKNLNLSATLHSYFNRYRYYPGIAVEIDDIPLPVAGVKLYCSGKIDGWQQPRNQMFDDRAPRAGGSVSGGVTAAVTKHLLLSAAVSGKTAGWEAGEVSLERQFGITMGLSLWLPNRSQ